MDFRFTQEQEMFRDSIDEFMKKECPRDFVRHCDENSIFPREVIRKMAKLGWLCIQVPEEYGGMGCGPVELGLFLEQVARGMNGLAQCVYSSVIFAADYILKFGSESQKMSFLPRIADGDLLFAFALTEPNSGSDAASLRTAAVKNGGCFLINGQKTFCSCADVADYIYTAARTDTKAPKHKGISTFLVPREAPGLEVKGIRKLGHKNMSLSDIFFEDTPVPEENMVGNLNEGWINILHNVGRERFYLSAICVGSAQAVLDSALQYAMEREQFGKPIGS
ncbi:MAG TPA: acyl-CoA dehydrogenase family protein, partial [Bacteroidota bacterium]|nr:acyl-CoA dehydrogenase family protein [Bacteroidota bacterium]